MEPSSVADNTVAWLASAGMPMVAGWFLVTIVLIAVCWGIIVRFARAL